jgi:hypothetical protein
MNLLFLHGRLSTSATIFAFFMAAWAIWLVIRGRGVDGSYLGAILIGEALLVAQALVGVALWLGLEVRDGRGMHLLYGGFAVLVWPFVFTFTRTRTRRFESVLFAVGSLFLWGVLIRAIDTAGIL